MRYVIEGYTGSDGPVFIAGATVNAGLTEEILGKFEEILGTSYQRTRLQLDQFVRGVGYTFLPQPGAGHAAQFPEAIALTIYDCAIEARRPVCVLSGVGITEEAAWNVISAFMDSTGAAECNDLPRGFADFYRDFNANFYFRPQEEEAE